MNHLVSKKKTPEIFKDKPTDFIIFKKIYELNMLILLMPTCLNSFVHMIENSETVLESMRFGHVHFLKYTTIKNVIFVHFAIIQRLLFSNLT